MESGLALASHPLTNEQQLTNTEHEDQQSLNTCLPQTTKLTVLLLRLNNFWNWEIHQISSTTFPSLGSHPPLTSCFLAILTPHSPLCLCNTL